MSIAAGILTVSCLLLVASTILSVLRAIGCAQPRLAPPSDAATIKVEVAPTAPSSPTPPPLLDDEHASNEALRAAEKLISHAFVKLVDEKVIFLDHLLFPHDKSTGTPRHMKKVATLRGHGVQDPVGILFHALWALRTEPPCAQDWTEFYGQRVLHYRVRRRLASLLLVTIKHYTVTRVRKSVLAIILAEFIFDDEIPVWKADYQFFLQQQEGFELQVTLRYRLGPSLFDSSCTAAHASIDELQRTRGFGSEAVHFLHGSVFFLLGACLLFPPCTLLEYLEKHYGKHTVGLGVASALVTALCVANDPKCTFRLVLGKKVDLTALLLTRMACEESTDELRVGVYGPKTPHFCAKILSRENLALTERIFSRVVKTKRIF